MNNRKSIKAMTKATVTDCPGHDIRYAIDASKIQKELDYSPK